MSQEEQEQEEQEQEPHLISSYNKGTIGLYLRLGEWVGVRKVSGGCLEGVCKLSGRCLEGIWKVSGRCLEDVWKVSGRCKFFGTQIFSGNNFFQSIQNFS